VVSKRRRDKGKENVGKDKGRFKKKVQAYVLTRLGSNSFG